MKSLLFFLLLNLIFIRIIFSQQDPIDATQYGAVAHLQTSDIEMNLQIDSNGAKINSGDSLNFKNASLTLNSGKTFTLENNSHLTFDGENSYLNAKTNSFITLGDNSSIEFKNGAHIKADGCIFTGLNSSIRWTGIKLSNTGTDTIINCKFNNAKTAITITNNSNTIYNEKVIKNDTFNVPSGGNYFGINLSDCYNLNLSNNVFNMPTSTGYNYIGALLKHGKSGIGVIEVSGEGEGGGEAEGIQVLNVVNNTFNDGTASLIITNYTSNILQYYIYNNSFTGSDAANMILTKVVGTVKKNYLESDLGGVHLFNSSPNLSGNSIHSKEVTLNLHGYSYPNLSPLRSEDYLIWYGGYNELSSDTSDVIILNSGGNVYTDFGHNTFTNGDTDTSDYHIYGRIDTAVHSYATRENCWQPQTVPGIYLERYGDSIPIIIKFHNNGYDCQHTATPTSYDILDMGSGFIDSTFISADNTATAQSDEDILYEQASQFYERRYYTDAIINFKELIDNFPSEYYVQSVIYELYYCYEALDTNEDQNYRNTLFGNLSLYLADKIESELYSNDFNDIAFETILMCEANIENYNYALNGYEFISLFHPDPDVRLMASWDYEAIESLIDSGSGGGVSNKLKSEIEIEESEEREFARINNFVNDDPLMSRMKRSYEEKEIIEENGFFASLRMTKMEKTKLENAKQKIIKQERAKRNIFELKNLSEEKLEQRRIEDLFLMVKDNRTESELTNPDNLPTQFILGQNYPNPFNPTTKINYTLSENGFVTIKVFDILGKEVMTLINQKQNAGSYSVEFKGSNLSSGVYYYKFESIGNEGQKFAATKRMVLVK